jgi:hypothetical protein
MMERAFEPALQHNSGNIERSFDRMLVLLAERIEKA